MALNKKKILWVVYDFNQAGGQRYVYEICKALNKDKFEIDILKVAPMLVDKTWNKEFYYNPTKQLGCTIYLLDELLQHGKPQPSYLSKLKLTKISNEKKKANRKQDEDQGIRNFFKQYDHINFSGINVFKSICLSRDLLPSNSLIHILTAKFQDKIDIYSGYDKSYSYHFVSSFPDDVLKNELEGFSNFSHTYFPLCFETKPYEVNNKLDVESKPNVIAVFTRLTGMKPLDPYFYALKLLLEKGIDVELHVFGAGNSEEAGFVRQLKYLYLTDKVKFNGHVESIPECIQQTKIDLVWFQSNNQLPAGYAALEIAMAALPQIFWDFSDMGFRSSVGEIFPSFTDLTAFVHYSEELLRGRAMGDQLGRMQRDYVVENYSSHLHINILEELYQR